jgi:hypothetical protein
MSIISFTCDKNYIYVLIYYIFELGRSILENFESKNKRDINNIIFNIDSQYIQIILFIFADLLFFPFVIYTKCAADTQLINNNPVSSKLKKIISYIILISILDLLSRSVYFLFFIFIYIKGEDIIENLPKRYNMDYILALDIFFRYLFSKIILKTKIYKHHKVSIIICIIGFVLLIANDCIFISFKIINIIYILIILPRAILFPLEDTINQILLSKYFLLPHYLMVYRGIIEFAFFSLITFILIILKIELFEINMEFYIYCILLISYSIKAFCLMKVIYIFNSQYVSFLVISETVGATIVMFLKEKNTKFVTNILEIISLFLVIFGTLMYNEIIIINLFGLETKTKKNLTLEQDIEINEQIIALNSNENNLKMED